MPSYQLDLTLAYEDGALSRVIDVASYRGFKLVRIDGEAYVAKDRWHLHLTVESEKPVQMLRSQLEKLIYCEAIEDVTGPATDASRV